uniref:Reverse transcriptase domain-containing protein n=1 Tax=Peronospora matthiolae TaxID=2874970 RepID=A0AAV1UEY8_9STRA
MIRKLHDSTTARFLVNGQLSESMELNTGIRQGFPLALLLFVLAVEVLALAITQDPGLTGVMGPGRHQSVMFFQRLWMIRRSSSRKPDSFHECSTSWLLLGSCQVLQYSHPKVK